VSVQNAGEKKIAASLKKLLENRLVTRVSHLRVSHRHGGARRFLAFLVI
jgi:hypothetical protein